MERMTREEAEMYAGDPLGTKTSGRKGALRSQMVYLALLALLPVKCPNCENPLAEVDAIQIEGDHHECHHCHAKVRYSVPLFGPQPWYWTLEPGQIKVLA